VCRSLTGWFRFAWLCNIYIRRKFFIEILNHRYALIKLNKSHNKVKSGKLMRILLSW